MDKELLPFQRIAERKGVKLVIGGGESRRRPRRIHLDMDMIRASIENAISRAGKRRQLSIRRKLQRLLSKGTAAQKIEFVHGSGRYFFPEDLEKFAAASTKKGGRTFGIGCRIFCFISCICLADFTQECREKCREVCESS